jgi:hypothetical protein
MLRRHEFPSLYSAQTGQYHHVPSPSARTRRDSGSAQWARRNIIALPGTPIALLRGSSELVPPNTVTRSKLRGIDEEGPDNLINRVMKIKVAPLADVPRKVRCF